MNFSKSDNINWKDDLKSAQLDFEKLQFPLTLRKWKEGDKFIPLGMKTFKKLSDYFIDNKFSLLEKKKQWLLCSGKDIIWVVGHRIDNRYKLESKTKKVYIAQLLD
jgi:tRNA(Ile)-lysidine synthase